MMILAVKKLFFTRRPFGTLVGTIVAPGGGGCGKGGGPFFRFSIFFAMGLVATRQK